MGLPIGQRVRRKFVYDFAVNGGAVSVLTLSAKDFAGSTFAAGFVIEKVSIHVETAFTSGGTPTVKLGNTGDDDGFCVDIWASLAAVGALRSGNVAGALLWDDTNDCEKEYYVNATANNQNVIMTVGTAAITAGKMNIYIDGYRAS